MCFIEEDMMKEAMFVGRKQIFFIRANDIAGR